MSGLLCRMSGRRRCFLAASAAREESLCGVARYFGGAISRTLPFLYKRPFWATPSLRK